MRTALTFIAGALTAWLLLSFVFPKKSSVELRSKGGDAAAFGVRHSYGESARAEAAIIGVAIPEDAIDCFYSIGGLNPVLEFIAFTVPKDKLWPFVTELTGKEKSDTHIPMHTKGPELFGDECRTVLYDMPRVSSATAINWKLKGGLSAECVIDASTGRLFILVTPAK